MIEIKDVTEIVLNTSDVFKDLLIDCPYSLEESPNGRLLALAAYAGPLPVGICVAFYYPPIQSGFIAHFFVNPDSRGQGVASALFTMALTRLKSSSIHSIEVRFSSAAEGRDAIAKLLHNHHFSPPIIQTVEYHFDVTKFNAPWYMHPPALQKCMSLFPWRSLSKKEEKEIAHWIHENPSWAPFNPLDLQQPIDLLTSIGIRKNGKLIGWMVNVKPKPNTLRFSSLFILPEERGTGAAIALLSASIALHRQHSPQSHAIASFNPNLSPPLWGRFVEKRLAPYSLAKNYTLFSASLDF